MHVSQTVPNEGRSSWLDRPLLSRFTLNPETIIFAIILILALVSRLYDLGTRVMSHDETSHVYFSWLFEQGRDYSHDPVTHGPLQFHLVAFSFFMFGDNDFTARLPVALFSVATIAFMWNYRRFLGRAGALIAAALFLISPFMLYYGRYVRNEAYVALFGVITIWAILRYLESGSPRYLLWLTAATALHFTAKETSFIYTAQALIFLALYLISRIIQRAWPNPTYRKYFTIALILALIIFSAAGVFSTLNRTPSVDDAAETAAPAIPGEGLDSPTFTTPSVLLIVLAILGAIALLAAAYFLIRGYTWPFLRAERSFGLIVLLFTLVMPMLASFPVKFLGYNPIDYNNNQTIIVTAVFIVVLTIIAIATGVLWNMRLWLVNVALFYTIFAVLYTSIFTNGFGFITGLVGSLGYWLEQQAVNRGSQPSYYYWMVQVPIYEYLTALGSFLAVIFGVSWWSRFDQKHKIRDFERDKERIDIPYKDIPNNNIPDQEDMRESSPPFKTLVVVLLSYWSVTSLIAYTIAGEKMPWLTVHIALPMILLTGWFLGHLIETTNWTSFQNKRGLLVVILLPIFFTSALAAFGTLLGPNPPFQGRELEQLKSTSTFITALLTAVGCGWGLVSLVKDWSFTQALRVGTLVAFLLIGILTTRTAIMAAFINYDYATEYLVYAHMARGPKEALAQIEEISRRVTGGLALRVAYDNDTTYPYWWYLRNYTNPDYFGENPTRKQREAPVILVGEGNYGKIEPVVGQAYHKFEYTRIWWPNQDYYGLTRERILEMLTDPQMRTAIFQIWLNRDYTLYSQLTDKDMSLLNWSPAQGMRLYVRKDIISQMWNYGTIIAPEAIVADPYEGKQVTLTADRIFGMAGIEPGQFQRPRDLAVAPDGSLYIADTENHRIQHLSADGEVLKTWGSFADINTGQAPGGTFNEPWGIAVGPDGSVYVADTWNHRVQKFTANGEFIATWGFFGQGETPEAFWGPRDVEVNADGEVFVTDTGNKRVVVFDADGNYRTQFGEVGLGPGQFDEPVGLAASSKGEIYVTDTWNQRIQVFTPSSDGEYSPTNNWEIVGWYGQSLDNKPYIAVDAQEHVFVTDPEGYRVLEFTNQGEFVKYWGDYTTEADGFGLIGSIAIDPEGGVWVTDTGNSRIMHFTLPAP